MSCTPNRSWEQNSLWYSVGRHARASVVAQVVVNTALGPHGGSWGSGPGTAGRATVTAVSCVAVPGSGTLCPTIARGAGGPPASGSPATVSVLRRRLVRREKAVSVQCEFSPEAPYVRRLTGRLSHEKHVETTAFARPNRDMLEGSTTSAWCTRVAGECGRARRRRRAESVSSSAAQSLAGAGRGSDLPRRLGRCSPTPAPLSRTAGARYRLPTEAEWEQAAAGSLPGCHRSRTGNVGTCPVGSYGANRLRLSDMVANVWEWTDDCGKGDCGGRVKRGRTWQGPTEDHRPGALQLATLLQLSCAEPAAAIGPRPPLGSSWSNPQRAALARRASRQTFLGDIA